jgi:hypothetical protein
MAVQGKGVGKEVVLQVLVFMVFVYAYGTLEIRHGIGFICPFKSGMVTR